MFHYRCEQSVILSYKFCVLPVESVLWFHSLHDLKHAKDDMRQYEIIAFVRVLSLFH